MKSNVLILYLIDRPNFCLHFNFNAIFFELTSWITRVYTTNLVEEKDYHFDPKYFFINKSKKPL